MHDLHNLGVKKHLPAKQSAARDFSLQNPCGKSMARISATGKTLDEKLCHRWNMNMTRAIYI